MKDATHKTPRFMAALHGAGRKVSHTLLSAALIAMTGLAAQPAHAEISQIPLFVGGQVDPNILFVLDDSGSMQWEVMPDENLHFSIYLFPRPSSVYGGSVYTSQVPDFLDNNIHNAFGRSPHNNTVFYNPEITYQPWVDENNNSMGDALPTAAPYNPANSGAGTMNLTVQQTQSAYWFRNTTNNNLNNAWYSCGPPCNQSFYPITFFMYKGSGDVAAPSSYVKYQIRGSSGYRRDLDGGSETGVSTFTWDNGIERTVLEERQNFANWFTYYRSRILAARAGIGRAFAQQGKGMRVGFGAINKGSTSIDGVSTRTIIRGLRPFSGTDRADFFTNLYEHPIPTAGTPLRRALDDAGIYYSRTDNRGPWGNTPGTNDTTDHLTCRQSYTVLMTDGYWNSSAAGTSGARANNDGTDGPTITGPDSQSFTYEAVSPFTDGWSNTLADVAMYYWKRDLRTDLDNEVPVSPIDPAFWQHMVTFGVGLGVTGTIDPDDAFAAIDSGATITWPQPSTSGTTEKIDDLLHAGVNSRGGFFSAADPDTFATELADTLDTIVNRAKTSTTKMSVTSPFFAQGESRTFRASYDSDGWSGELVSFTLEEDDDGDLIITEDWQAEDGILAYGSRNILSINGGTGIDFLWANLNATQKGYLGADATEQQAVLNYLRGDDSGEGTTYRDRGTGLDRHVLGDIVNSDPVYVHKEHFGYHTLGGTEGSTYPAYRESKKARDPMVYVGANDGMLHGFKAKTGAEVFAYVPNAVYSNLKSLSEPDYTHKFFVDGKIHVSDAHIGGAWKTILVGTLGAGGKSVFAIDVTDPSATAMNASKVLWEYTEADLGYTFAKPVIARLKDGTWAAIFGNGYGSASNRAFLYIVNLATGALIRKIDTGAGDATTPNGLSGPSYYLESGGTSQYASTVYAGDLLGNLWKFDLTHNNSNNWDVAFKTGPNKYPLFTARNASNQVQPITVEPDLKRHDDGGYQVFFGTGKYFETGDPGDLTEQTLYGIRDDNSSRIMETDRSTLQAQTIIYEATFADIPVRAYSDNSVNWSTKRGWYMDLVSPVNGAEGERMIRPPEIWFDRLRFNTIIPNEDPCSGGGRSWLRQEIDFKTGARLNYPIFDLDGDGEYDSVTIDGEEVPIGGIGNGDGGGIGEGVSVGGYYVPPDGEVFPYFDGLEGVLGRQGWREIR